MQANGRASKRVTGWSALVCLALAGPAAAHHPVGIPQYRAEAGEIVMIYNVLTEDHIARLVARPGRPVCDAERPVVLDLSITPRDPQLTFRGGTWLSVVEDLGDRGEREIVPARLQSNEASARRFSLTHVFDQPGDYIVKLEYTESLGQEILGFPLRVTRSAGSSTGGALKLLAAGLAGVVLLALGRAAAQRRRRRLAEPGGTA